MKAKFDVKNLIGHRLTLQKGQIDIVLDALAFYLYTYKWIYPCKKPLTELESTRISQVKNTYLQISSQITENSENSINRTIVNSIENKKKKISKKVA